MNTEDGIRNSLERLKKESPMAAEVLCMGAMLAGAPLPVEFALHTEGGMHSPALLNPAAAVFAVAATLEPLTSRGLIVDDPESQTFIIPQNIRDDILASLSTEERKEWAVRACHVLNLSLPDAEPGNWKHAEPLMPHVEACLALAEQGVQSASLNRILHQTGFFMFQQERYADAILYLQAALKVDLGIKGKMHPDIAADREGLGMVMLAAGDVDGAEQEYRRCIELREAILTPENPMLAPALDGLAYAFLGQGRRGEAVRSWERAASIMQQAVGNDHPFVQQCRENVRQYA